VRARRKVLREARDEDEVVRAQQLEEVPGGFQARTPAGKRNCRMLTSGAGRCRRNTRALMRLRASGSRFSRRVGSIVRSLSGLVWQNSTSAQGPVIGRRRIVTAPANKTPAQVVHTPLRHE